jgi:hypothetical protein
MKLGLRARPGPRACFGRLATLRGPGRNPTPGLVLPERVSPTAASTRARWASLVLPALVLAGALGLALALGPPDPADAAKARVLGKTRQDPKPSCPRNPCEAVGSVTGFQQEANGEQRPFKIRQDGHIVAWSLDLSKPDRSQRDFFGDFYEDNQFGKDPAAELAILKPQGDSEFKLKRHSPVVDLGSDLGRMPLFTLNAPLRVKKGDVVGLTIPTWLPNFAVELSRENSWRASRAPKKCENENDIREGRPLREVGKSRRFGCEYETARLLYWAYFVPARGDGGGGNDGGGGGNDGGGGGNDGGGGGGGGGNP